MKAKLTSLLSPVTDGQSLVSKLAARIFEEESDAEDTWGNPANHQGEVDKKPTAQDIKTEQSDKDDGFHGIASMPPNVSADEDEIIILYEKPGDGDVSFVGQILKSEVEVSELTIDEEDPNDQPVYKPTGRDIKTEKTDKEGGFHGIASMPPNVAEDEDEGEPGDGDVSFVGQILQSEVKIPELTIDEEDPNDQSVSVSLDNFSNITNPPGSGSEVSECKRNILNHLSSSLNPAPISNKITDRHQQFP